MRVTNMQSSNGNAVPNQFILSDDKGTTLFQSYETIIAKIEHRQDGPRKITLDAGKLDYSKTTSKYRNLFLGMTTDETKRAIKQGTITLADLNQ